MNIQTNLPVGCAQVTLLLMGEGPWVHIRARAGAGPGTEHRIPPSPPHKPV